MEREEPVEHELLRNATIAEITVTSVSVEPTSIGDRYVRITGSSEMRKTRTSSGGPSGSIYAIGLLSFHGARPRGTSYIDFKEHDEWTAADMQRHLRFERGRLSFEADYVRGRMMKTDVTVFPDGRFTITTTNRGEAATRWVARLQGRKVVADVASHEA